MGRRPQCTLRNPFALVAGLVLLAAAPACDDADLAANLGLLERGNLFVAQAVPLKGERRVLIFDGAHAREHRERILVFNAADVAADLTEVDGRAPNELEKLLFVKNARAHLQYRDLALDGVERVLANYRVRRQDDSQPVAGRATFHLTFRHRSGGASVDVWGDRDTGVALRVVRTNPEGVTTYLMEYVAIEYGPIRRTPGDPPTLPRRPVAAAPSASFEALSFPNAEETLDFDGLVHAERQFSEILVDGRVYQGCVDRFTDGLQHLFVVQGDPGHDFWIVEPPRTEAELSTFYSASLASLNVVWTRKEGRSLAAYGPFSAEGLATLLERYERPR